jgi:CO/xanthine dehydrogenase Mo-binding subunit
MIEVDYEPLPVITDFVAAMEPDAPLVHTDWASYERDENMVAEGNTIAYHTIVKGDADAAMAQADVVLRSRYESDASQGVPIEPRAVVAEWKGEEVTIWSSTQVPYAARAGVAQTLEIPEANVRVVVPLLGGGFGAKCDLHFEAQVAALARAARRPVKLVFSREEEFRAIAQRREGIVMEFETGATRDGRWWRARPGWSWTGGVLRRGRGSLGQMASDARVARIDRQRLRESFLNYTNQQPIGLDLGNTAPRCAGPRATHRRGGGRARLDSWSFCRRTLIEKGAEGPTRQIFDETGQTDLERAVEMIGYGANP